MSNGSNGVNELELKVVVWFVKNFKYYLIGKSVTVFTDQRALLSVMKEHRWNKYYNSRITRWSDRFYHLICYVPGAKMGLVDYISRQPNQKPNIQTKMIRNLRVQQLPAFVTQLQQFKKIPHPQAVNHSTLTQ